MWICKWIWQGGAAEHLRYNMQQAACLKIATDLSQLIWFEGRRCMGEVVEPQLRSGVETVGVPVEWRAAGPKHDIQVICKGIRFAEVLHSIALHILWIEEEHWPVHQSFWIQKGLACACRQPCCWSILQLFDRAQAISIFEAYQQHFLTLTEKEIHSVLLLMGLTRVCR